MVNKKSVPELQEILSAEIDLLRSGRANPQRANAICSLVNSTLTSFKLQLQFLGEGYFDKKLLLDSK